MLKQSTQLLRSTTETLPETCSVTIDMTTYAAVWQMRTWIRSTTGNHFAMKLCVWCATVGTAKPTDMPGMGECGGAGAALGTASASLGMSSLFVAVVVFLLVLA